MRPLPHPVLASLSATRTTIILVLPCIIGAATGTLTYLACHSVPQALLAAGPAAAGFAQLLSQVIGTTPEQPASGQDNNRNDSQSDDIKQTKA